MWEAINGVKIYVEIDKSNLWKHLLKANDNVYTLAFMNQKNKLSFLFQINLCNIETSDALYFPQKF